MGHAAYAAPEGEATASPPAPEGVGIGYQLEASIASTYVFRGILQYGRLADPSSQNTATLRFDRLGPGALSLSVWNATSLANFRENATASLEFDLGATYAVDLGAGVNVSLGYTTFLYPEHIQALPYDAAHEISVGVTWANEWVSPSLVIAAEVARMRGVYASLGAGRDFPLGPLVLSPALSVGIAGYNDFEMRLDGTTWRRRWPARRARSPARRHRRSRRASCGRRRSCGPPRTSPPRRGA